MRKNLKKIFSLVLAVSFLIGAMTVQASASTFSELSMDALVPAPDDIPVVETISTERVELPEAEEIIEPRIPGYDPQALYMRQIITEPIFRDAAGEEYMFKNEYRIYFTTRQYTAKYPSIRVDVPNGNVAELNDFAAANGLVISGWAVEIGFEIDAVKPLGLSLKANKEPLPYVNISSPGSYTYKIRHTAPIDDPTSPYSFILSGYFECIRVPGTTVTNPGTIATQGISAYCYYN